MAVTKAFPKLVRRSVSGFTETVRATCIIMARQPDVPSLVGRDGAAETMFALE